MSDRVNRAPDLAVGSVVMIAVQLTDKKTGAPFWWRRFAWVNEIINERFFHAITLKPELDDNCFREVDVTKDVVTTVSEATMPQGVSAMVVKHLAKGRLQAAF